VKPLCADDSVGSPHVKVGHRRELNTQNPICKNRWGFFMRVVLKYFLMRYNSPLAKTQTCPLFKEMPSLGWLWAGFYFLPSPPTPIMVLALYVYTRLSLLIKA
jgi:hypothetical protein